MESCGEMEIAKNFYQSSKDYLSLVRIYCYTDQVDKVICLGYMLAANVLLLLLLFLIFSTLGSIDPEG